MCVYIYSYLFINHINPPLTALTFFIFLSCPGKVLAALTAHDTSVESVGFCDCMPLAASAGMDGKLCIWDLNTYGLRHTCLHDAGITGAPIRIYIYIYIYIPGIRGATADALPAAHRS